MGFIPGRIFHNPRSADTRERSELEETFEEIVERTGGFPVNAAHRGGGGEFGPENTMYSFRKAVACGARLLEVDLRLTRDGELCIIHDAFVDRTTSGSGPVYAHLLTEMRALNAAHHYPELGHMGVPSFAEFLTEFAPVKDLLLFLDFKDEEAVRVALRMMAPLHLANRCMLGSVFEECNQFLRDVRHSSSVPLCTDTKQGILITVAHDTGLWERLHFTHDVYGFMLRKETRRFWSRSLVEAVHRAGPRVLVCGGDLSTKGALRECVDYGVDYIMTDRPDLLQEVLAKKYFIRSRSPPDSSRLAYPAQYRTPPPPRD
jgi:glycerophosphoryl diester phosphodiesterase